VTPAVVCAVDDLRGGGAVVATAGRLAERLGVTLVLLHGQPALLEAEPQVAYAAGGVRPAGRTALAPAGRGIARLAAAWGAPAGTELRVGSGDAARRALAAAREERAALVVIGAHAADPGLLARADLPVVVVPSAATPARDGSPILCGIDGSAGARFALRTASSLAGPRGAGLVAVHVARSAGDLGAGGRLLERVLAEERLDDAGRRVVAGTPADRLADLADEEGAELVAVGSRGRGALRAAILGSVSAGLVAVARRPVLVVPPQYAS
jgi:nucleotide-binding universal stress UspA family protein